jgi:hypothetical protein
VARFQEAKFSFEEAGLTDDEEIVHITAYVFVYRVRFPCLGKLLRKWRTTNSVTFCGGACSTARASC